FLVLLFMPPRIHLFFFSRSGDPPHLPSFPTRRSSDLRNHRVHVVCLCYFAVDQYRAIIIRECFGDCGFYTGRLFDIKCFDTVTRSEEHTSELQSLTNLVCRLLLEKKKRPSTFTSGALHAEQSSELQLPQRWQMGSQRNSDQQVQLSADLSIEIIHQKAVITIRCVA